MRLICVIDDYLPESTRVSPKMMHELACFMASQGHDIVVLTPGSRNQAARLEKVSLDNIQVWRFRSGPVKDISRVRRLINESLLSFNAWLGLRGDTEAFRFDGVVCYSPSIFFGPLVRWLKKKNDCKSYLVLRDLFPQWAIDEGMIGQHSFAAKYLRFFERLNYKAADRIGLMSAANVQVFNKLNFGQFDTEVLPNWVAPVKPYRAAPCWREKLGLQGKVIYLYGGNMGKAQDMPNLLRLAKNMRECPPAHFLFVGQGEDYELVASYIKEHGLDNTTLLPSISQSEFSDLLGEVDVGLFSLARTHTAHNFPGKILGYIANSIPILGSVNLGNDLLPVICESQAGFVFVNGEDDKLLVHAKEMAVSESFRKNLGINARKLLDDRFSVVSVANRLNDFFSDE